MLKDRLYHFHINSFKKDMNPTFLVFCLTTIILANIKIGFKSSQRVSSLLWIQSSTTCCMRDVK